MSLQDLFYLLFSIFLILAIGTLVFVTTILVKVYSKVTKVVDSVEHKVLVSNRFLQRFQLGILGTLLGIIKIFR